MYTPTTEMINVLGYKYHIRRVRLGLPHNEYAWSVWWGTDNADDHCECNQDRDLFFSWDNAVQFMVSQATMRRIMDHITTVEE